MLSLHLDGRGGSHTALSALLSRQVSPASTFKSEGLSRWQIVTLSGSWMGLSPNPFSVV